MMIFSKILIGYFSKFQSLEYFFVKMKNDPKYDINEYQMTISALQHERSQLYFYLQQKSDESLNYYNEIQRLNGLVLDLNKDLIENKEKYQHLENELNLGMFNF